MQHVETLRWSSVIFRE